MSHLMADCKKVIISVKQISELAKVKLPQKLLSNLEDKFDVVMVVNRNTKEFSLLSGDDHRKVISKFLDDMENESANVVKCL